FEHRARAGRQPVVPGERKGRRGRRPHLFSICVNPMICGPDGYDQDQPLGTAPSTLLPSGLPSAMSSLRA
ncbi:MAG TPA: hypothetical protein P5316_16665, partial [Phycisphaerae bacterium]|nr:hypothetical protein [Phycisphaerae bacterium]